MTWTDKEFIKFCSRPLLAVLSTASPSGSPQASVVWYGYEDGCFIVSAFANRHKVRNIRRNERVCLSVVDPEDHDRPLMLRGRAEIVEDGAQEATRRLAVRYLGQEQGERRADELARRPRVILRIRPESFLEAD